MNQPKIGVLICLVLQCVALGVAVSASHLQGADSFKIYPESIHVSPNHPAKLLVYACNDDGSMSEMRDMSKMKITVREPSFVSVDDKNQLRFQGVGSTRVVVRIGEQEQAITVTAIDDSPVTFTRDVAAVIGKSGCNLGTCHGSLHGKAGLRLSLRGDDLAFDFDRLVNEFGGRRIDRFDAKDSLLLRKATGAVSHLGGRRFSADSESYQHIKQWIEGGANFTESAPLARLQILPEVARIDDTHRTAPILVVAHFADGTTRDVTRWTRLEPSIPDGALISDDGIIEAPKAIDLSVSASYLNGRAATRITFLGHDRTANNIVIESRNRIDQLVEQRLQSMRVFATPIADDTTFLRRLYLVAVGRLPSSDEAREFLSSDAHDKRDRLVDRLMADQGFALQWALRWSDLLRNEDKVMSSKGASLFHRWLTKQIAADRPWNEWMAELIRTVGSTYENPPASFHRTHRDPAMAAESIGQVFLGVRIQCAKCHNHPFDSWRQDDYYGLAAYFTTISRKQIDNNPKDKLDSHEITGDEIISLENRKAEIVHPGLSRKVPPVPLRRKSLEPNQTEMVLDAESPLSELADWITNDNELFDRNMANRIWYQYFGIGIVDQPDDFRDSNPPSNPELLDYLASEFRRSGYSLMHLSRLILTSQTFARQGAWQREETLDENTINGTPLFANYRVRRMNAEPLLDAISSVTDVPSEYPSANTPEIVAHQAMAMPGIPKGPGFLRTFGKPNRLLICECERSNQVSLVQSLSLANGPEVLSKVASKQNVIGRILAEGFGPEKAIEEIYLSALSRFPHEQEWRTFRESLARGENPRSVLEDILWAVLNSKEFVMIR